jgi:hypothetical protein
LMRFPRLFIHPEITSAIRASALVAREIPNWPRDIGSTLLKKSPAWGL